MAGIVLNGLGRRWLGGRWPLSRLPGTTSRSRWRAMQSEIPLLAALVFAANAPDLDFVPGILIGDADRYHHGPFHSLGAAIGFGVAAGLLARLFRARGAARFGTLMGIAFASHLLLDMFSIDHLAPAGVPLFWPASDQHFVLPIALFMDIHRNPAAGNFVVSVLLGHNYTAMLWELVVMGLVMAVVRAITIGFAIKGVRSPSEQGGEVCTIPAED